MNRAQIKHSRPSTVWLDESAFCNQQLSPNSTASSHIQIPTIQKMATAVITPSPMKPHPGRPTTWKTVLSRPRFPRTDGTSRPSKLPKIARMLPSWCFMHIDLGTNGSVSQPHFSLQLLDRHRWTRWNCQAGAPIKSLADAFEINLE